MKVEEDYSAGVKGLRLIGKENNVSAPMILRKAKANGWTRDLTERIQIAARAKVNAAIVTAKSYRTVDSDKANVGANSDMIAKVVLGQRKGAAILTEIAEKLTKELKANKNKMSLAEKVLHLQRLADTRRTLVGIERQVFGIADSSTGKSLGEMLADMQ